MPNIPKPDLERGNYICYADEPGTIMDNAGGGGDEGGGGEGGGGDDGSYDMNFVVTLSAGTLSDYATIPFFMIDGEEITGFDDVTVPEQQSTYKKTVTVKPGSIVEPNIIDGYMPNSFTGCYEVLNVGNVRSDSGGSMTLTVIVYKNVADRYADSYDLGEPAIMLSYAQQDG